MWILGGGLDPLWHAIVGREVQLSILMSPTHIFFAVANILMITGPLRAAWRRPAESLTWRTFFPVLISLILLHWMLTFQTIYNHPIQAFPSPYRNGTIIAVFSDLLGTTGFIIHTAILMGLVLLVLRRWRLPFGTLGLLIGVHYGMLSAEHYYYQAIVPLVLAATLGAFACDLLAARLRPSYDHPSRLRLFAFLMPVVLYSFYFTSMALFDGVTWALHLVIGNIVLSGLVGLALATLVTAEVPRSP
jgi:hypothetical protein